MPGKKLKILFSDVGGVLGTNGWDTPLRLKIAEHFHVDHPEIESRHHLMFDTYESGKMSFEDYLRAVFFGAPRSFSVEEVRDYAYAASTPWPETIGFFRNVKRLNQLKFGIISNEGGGLTQHRVQKFGLRDLADFMIFSYFVHLRKPDRDIWRLGLNLAQAEPCECVYVDDRKMFADVAADLGFNAVHHTSLDETRTRLANLGLVVE
jgi:putative hydrolase of the HAD superfamily